MTTSPRQNMCVINPALVPLIAPLVGSQAEIMLRVGISWNSWNKILAAQPIRISMAERFRDRIGRIAPETDSFVAAFPAAEGGLDRTAFDDAFIMRAEQLQAGRISDVASAPMKACLGDDGRMASAGHRLALTA
jgi:hypothetical protein